MDQVTVFIEIAECSESKLWQLLQEYYNLYFDAINKGDCTIYYKNVIESIETELDNRAE
jgi:hypothetical protein